MALNKRAEILAKWNIRERERENRSEREISVREIERDFEESKFQREREKREMEILGGLRGIYMRELRPLFECPWIFHVTEKDSGVWRNYGGFGGGFWVLCRGILGILCV